MIQITLTLLRDGKQNTNAEKEELKEAGLASTAKILTPKAAEKFKSE